MFSRFSKRVGRVGAFVLGLLLALVIGVAAAILYQANLSASVEIVGAQMLVQEQFTDDDGVVSLNLVGWDSDDKGDSDPLGPAPNAARSASDIQTCTVTHDGNGNFTFDMVKSYQDAFCSVALKLKNEALGFSMVYQGTTTTLADVEIVDITPVGSVWGPNAAGEYVEFAVHVLPLAPSQVDAGSIIVEFMAE